MGSHEVRSSESEGERSVGQVGEHVDTVAAAADRQHLKHTTRSLTLGGKT